MTQQRDPTELDEITPFRFVYCDEGVGLADVDEVLLVVWRRDVSSARFSKQRRALTDVVTRYPGRAGLLCVVEPTSTPPNDELRKATMHMIHDQGTRLRAVACVIEGEGFRAAMARSVLSGLAMLLARSELQYGFSATVDAGSAWLATRCGVAPGPLVAGVDELRARMGSSV